MTPKQKQFVKKELIPFILREQGQGFGMNVWLAKDMIPGRFIVIDGIIRSAPPCGTVACIGGSIVLLKGINGDYTHGLICEAIGLTLKQGEILFHGSNTNWPKGYIKAYHAARSPLAKVKVAVRLLEKIMKKGPEKVLGI